MEKQERKEFYVGTEIWKKDLSLGAKSVFTYLCFCANKAGASYPSTSRIARECGMCRTTVQKRIKELVEKGCIRCSKRIVNTEFGRRQTTNLYQILVDRGPRKPAPGGAQTDEANKAEASSSTKSSPSEPSNAEPLTSVKTDAPKAQEVKKLEPKAISGSWSQSAAPAGAAPVTGLASAHDERDDDSAGLERLLGRLGVRELYEDKYAAKAVELAISDLWYAEETKIGGERVSKYRMRKRLDELDITAIDDVMASLGTPDVRDKAAFVKACIYNAPMRANARIAVQCANAQNGAWRWRDTLT